MFGNRFFGPRYFADRYFGDGGSVEITTSGGYWPYIPHHKKKRKKEEVVEEVAEALIEAVATESTVYYPEITVSEDLMYAAISKARQRRKALKKRSDEELMLFF